MIAETGRKRSLVHLSTTLVVMAVGGRPVGYRIPIVGTGYRFAAGHRLRFVLTSDDQDPKFPAATSFRTPASAPAASTP
jgi:predicted acyl esterase